MLVTFRSSAYADITMFGEVAQSLLKMMGQSGDVPGAILADQVAPALRALQQNVAKIESPALVFEDEEAAISLATRAQPLLQLMEAAASGGSDVIWEN